MKKVIIIFAFLIASSNFAFSQTDAETTAPVNISLIRGLTITATGGNVLDFGEIVVTGSIQNSTITAEDGQKFLTTGHPNRPTTFTYDATVTLNNNAWVATNGGTEAELTFTTATAKQTGKEVTYTNPQDLTSGSSVNLVNDAGTGKMYVWVGGDIEVPASHPQGDYVGTFNISVAY